MKDSNAFAAAMSSGKGPTTYKNGSSKTMPLVSMSHDMLMKGAGESNRFRVQQQRDMDDREGEKIREEEELGGVHGGREGRVGDGDRSEGSSHGIQVKVDQVRRPGEEGSALGEEPCLVKAASSSDREEEEGVDSAEKAAGMTRWRTEAGTIDSLSNKRTNKHAIG